MVIVLLIGAFLLATTAAATVQKVGETPQAPAGTAGEAPTPQAGKGSDQPKAYEGKIVDAKTKSPIEEAVVTLGDQQVRTDNEGRDVIAFFFTPEQ